ncbi:MAG: hemerythrin domain-containing protein [Bacteroidales bacterium]|nr:MAG: hemerythrin domain-containing protein [Bacteroidales bacterium]
MIIRQDNKMADLIHMNYLLISVINRFGIDLGFRDKTVFEVCREHHIDVRFFLEIVNAFHDKDYFPDEDLQDFSIRLIVDYLAKTHRYYLDEKIPEIEQLIDEMVNTCFNQTDNLNMLQKFFKEYKEELAHHTKREDEVVFPYAIHVEKAFTRGKADPDLKNQMNGYSITDYINEHDNIEEKLFDLKNIIIKYLPPPKNRALCNKVLSELFNLEKDMNDHSRIEEKVLVPKVIVMEKQLRKQDN